jgi:hypothetical protein
MRFTSTEDKSAYGEFTPGSIYKIFLALQKYANLQPDEILLDWGCGHCKILLGLLLWLPASVAIGIERDPLVFKGAEDLLIRAAKFDVDVVNRIGIIRADSQSFDSFAPASVVVQYDGPAIGLHQSFPAHKHIMKRVFGSPTVRVVVSTKLNQSRFEDYFPEKLPGGSPWTCVPLVGLSQGGSAYQAFLWIRTRSANRRLKFVDHTFLNPVVDARFSNVISTLYLKNTNERGTECK